MDDNIENFVRMVEEAKASFEALTLLGKLVTLFSAMDDPEGNKDEVLEQVLQEIISYGDRRVLEAMSK